MCLPCFNTFLDFEIKQNVYSKIYIDRKNSKLIELMFLLNLVI